MTASPTFIGVGVGKCATTWIFEMLSAHPEVGCSSIKELNFFSTEYPYYDLGIKWYETNFDAKYISRGEFSVTYSNDMLALERIAEHYPNVKLIFAVRNPLERALSDMYHDIRKGKINKNTCFLQLLKNRLRR